MLKPVLSGPQTFVWDLAVTAEGPRIYEFQAYEDSYFGGYQKVNDQSLNNIVENSWSLHGGEARSDFLRSCCHNKIICGSLLGPELPDLFPRQKTYVVNNYKKLAKQIAEDFSDCEGVVVKTPKGYRAEGVNVMSVDEIKAQDVGALISLFPANTSSHSGTLICYNVQEAIKAKPVEVRGIYYRPTVRLVATVSPTPSGEIQWRFHGGYYKLPLEGFCSAEEAIKAPINSSQSNGVISKSFNNNNDGAAVIPDDVYAELCQDIQTRMGPLLRHMTQANSTSYIVKALQSENQGDVIAAFTHLGYYDQKCGSGFEHINPLNIPEIAGLLVTASQSGGFVRDYIDYMCECGIEWAQELKAITEAMPTAPATTAPDIKAPPRVN